MSKMGPPDFAPPRVDVERRAGGVVIVRSAYPLGEHARHVLEWLARWARERPEAALFIERQGGRLNVATYAEVHREAWAAASWLAAAGAGPERPLMILSQNSTHHATLALGAMTLGAPFSSVSPAYSTLSRDHAKLRGIFRTLEPAVIFVEDEAAYGEALDALPLEGVTLVSARPTERARSIDEVYRTEVTDEARARHAQIGPETVAKILFTSGSTGEPKGVINTHRMLTSNQQAIAQVWPFLEKEPPVLVDWLPWSHTFGANHNLNMVLRNGGTMLIDEGKPAPGLIERTVENLRELSPTLYFNVPRGFDVLLPYLERDDALRAAFFRRLRLVFYAGAALPQSLWERLEALARREIGEPVAMASAWGATETAPLVTSVHFPIPRAGVIGLPAPGCEVKLVPNRNKLEMRVRGPNVTPGYHRDPERTARAFDEEGYYLIGDAGRFEDEERPELGLVFDGRVSESFKLTSGTWVHAGALRVALIAATAPVVQDAVITGHDRDAVGALLIPSVPACRELAGLDEDAPLSAVLEHSAVRRRVAEGLAAHNANVRGSSERVACARFLLEPLSIDAGEITDKGYVNQRAVLERRALEVASLHDEGSPGRIPAAERG